MNPVLEKILATREVTDGKDVYPLASNMDRREGALIHRSFIEAKARHTVEIGCAYAVSAMFACDALVEIGHADASHTIIDPAQVSVWKNIGMRNLYEAGYGSIVSHIPEGSEIALPRLLAYGKKFDAAIVDGIHTLDHALVDFFYVSKMLKVGGVVVVDDTQPLCPGVNRLIRYLAAYPCYEIFEIANVPAEFRELAASITGPGKDKEAIDWKGLPPEVFGSAVALKKIADDKRSGNWYSDF